MDKNENLNKILVNITNESETAEMFRDNHPVDDIAEIFRDSFSENDILIEYFKSLSITDQYKIIKFFKSIIEK